MQLEINIQHHSLNCFTMNTKTCLILLAICASALARSTLKNSRALPTPALDRYLTLDEANAYLDEVVSTYSDIASIEVIGKTAEARDIRALKLSNGGAAKPTVLVDALTHGREWVTLSAVLNAISELTENSVALLDTADFLIIPVISPDSYVYTWETDRAWRKNRETIDGSTCVGVDPNRNFNSHFGEGGNTDPCSDNYEGATAGSAAETKALVDFLTANPSISAYVSLHSFGPAFVYPPGYSLETPVDDALLRRVGEEAASAAAAAGSTNYDVGSTAEVLGLKFGQAVDYAHDVAGIPLTYTLELAPGGPSGWDPETTEIARIAAEAFAAIKVVANNAAK